MGSRFGEAFAHLRTVVFHSVTTISFGMPANVADMVAMESLSTKLTFPPEEADHLRQRYAEAAIILEYGSGGSTMLAASMPGKFVISVESDWAWALELQRQIDQAVLQSPAVVWHVDIGQTGRWGRPIDDAAWQKYHRYPLSIWSEPFFRHPDLILIDGRLRPACLIAAVLRITRPVTVLFDDYVGRPAYHVVESVARPVGTIGRMAEFRLEPGTASPFVQDLLIELCTHRTLAAQTVDYGA
jgi:hypothetical protein